ncbi:MAG: DUF6146 family protein [Leeuwenhoekiella sp.]
MRILIYSIIALLLVCGCASQNSKKLEGGDDIDATSDTVRIANDSLEYEIIIIEPGYNAFLLGTARPEGYYSQSYLENKNSFLVTEYNQRVMQPSLYNSNLYPLQIDYERNVDYGYEVNYKLYYYFVYFARKYNQRFSVPTRI